MTNSANCPVCNRENSVVEVRGSESAGTLGFWCLKCDQRWTTQGSAKHPEKWAKLEPI